MLPDIWRHSCTLHLSLQGSHVILIIIIVTKLLFYSSHLEYVSDAVAKRGILGQIKKSNNINIFYCRTKDKQIQNRNVNNNNDKIKYAKNARLKHTEGDKFKLLFSCVLCKYQWSWLQSFVKRKFIQAFWLRYGAPLNCQQMAFGLGSHESEFTFLLTKPSRSTWKHPLSEISISHRFLVLLDQSRKRRSTGNQLSDTCVTHAY